MRNIGVLFVFVCDNVGVKYNLSKVWLKSSFVRFSSGLSKPTGWVSNLGRRASSKIKHVYDYNRATGWQSDPLGGFGPHYSFNKQFSKFKTGWEFYSICLDAYGLGIFNSFNDWWAARNANLLLLKGMLDSSERLTYEMVDVVNGPRVWSVRNIAVPYKSEDSRKGLNSVVYTPGQEAVYPGYWSDIEDFHCRRLIRVRINTGLPVNMAVIFLVLETLVFDGKVYSFGLLHILCFVAMEKSGMSIKDVRKIYINVFTEYLMTKMIRDYSVAVVKGTNAVRQPELHRFLLRSNLRDEVLDCFLDHIGIEFCICSDFVKAEIEEILFKAAGKVHGNPSDYWFMANLLACISSFLDDSHELGVTKLHNMVAHWVDTYKDDPMSHMGKFYEGAGLDGRSEFLYVKIKLFAWATVYMFKLWGIKFDDDEVFNQEIKLKVLHSRSASTEGRCKPVFESVIEYGDENSSAAKIEANAKDAWDKWNRLMTDTDKLSRFLVSDTASKNRRVKEDKKSKK